LALATQELSQRPAGRLPRRSRRDGWRRRHGHPRIGSCEF